MLVTPRYSPNQGTQPVLLPYLASICVVGPISVGKTTLVKRLEGLASGVAGAVQLNKEKFSPQPSIMAEFTRLELEVNSSARLRINLTDTPGMKKLFFALPASIVRNQCGYLIVFDLTDRDTFKDIREWFGPVRDYAAPFAEIFLIGNKADQEEKRQVQYHEGISVANSMGAKYYETSSTDGSSVMDIFRALAQNIVGKVDFGTLDVEDPKNGFTLLDQSGMPIKHGVVNRKTAGPKKKPSSENDDEEDIDRGCRC
jgi:Ras-related protein Rab-1A